MKILKQKRRKKYEPNPNQVITAETQALWDASVRDLRAMLTMQGMELARVTERKRTHFSSRTGQWAIMTHYNKRLGEWFRKVRVANWRKKNSGPRIPGYTKAKRSIRRKAKRIEQELARRAAC